MKSIYALRILVFVCSISVSHVSFSAINTCEDVFNLGDVDSKISIEYFKEGTFLGINSNDTFNELLERANKSQNPQFRYLEFIGLKNMLNEDHGYVLDLNKALRRHNEFVNELISSGKIRQDDAIYATKSTGLLNSLEFFSLLATGLMPLSVEGGVKVEEYNFRENVTLHDLNHLGVLTDPKYMKIVRRAAKKIIKDQNKTQLQKNFTFFFEFLVLINPNFKRQIQQHINAIKNKHMVSLKYRDITRDIESKIQMGEGFNLHLLGTDPSKLIEFYSDIKEIYNLTQANHFWEHYGGSVRGFEISELSEYDDIENVLKSSTILLQFRPDLTFRSNLRVLSLPNEKILKQHPLMLEQATLSAWTFILALEEIINLDMESLAKALFEDSDEARQLYNTLCKRKIMPFSVCPDQNLD